MTKRKKAQMTDDIAQLALVAPMVVAQRMTRLALASDSLSAGDRKEMNLMSAEKFSALTESWNNTTIQMTRAYMNLGFDLMRLGLFPWHRTGGLVNAAAARFSQAATNSFQESLAPIRRRVVANSKRLARKSSR